MPKKRRPTTGTRPRALSERVPVSNRLLRKEAACEKIGARPTMFDEIRATDPRFPKAVRIGKRALGWLETELEAYVALIAQERRVS